MDGGWGGAGLHVPPPAPLLFPALFHMAGHESVECDTVRDVALNSELEAASRFFCSPVFGFLSLSCFLLLLLGPVGHWVSVTVNTNMLRHAFDGQGLPTAPPAGKHWHDGACEEF